MFRALSALPAGYHGRSTSFTFVSLTSAKIFLSVLGLYSQALVAGELQWGTKRNLTSGGHQVPTKLLYHSHPQHKGWGEKTQKWLWVKIKALY